MPWTGRFFGFSDEMFARGVEGYFMLSVDTGGGTPTRVDAVSSTLVSFTAPNFLGRMTFTGVGLTVGTVRLPNGTDLPVLTGGTITGIDFRFNNRLWEVIENGGNTLPFLQPAFLDPSALLSLPNISAAAMTAAIVQSYRTGSFAPFEAFLSRETVNFVGTNGVNQLTGFNNNDVLRGLGGNDLLSGRGGNDLLDGGAGTDAMDGGQGSDTYLPGPSALIAGVGDSVGDTGTGPRDIDTLSYANSPSGLVIDLDFRDGNQSTGWATAVLVSGIERVVGSNFNDIIGGTGIQENIQDTPADTLVGGGGDDTLVGLEGQDVLIGGPGNDVLFGDFTAGGSGGGDVAQFNARNAQMHVFYAGDGSILVAAPGGGVDRLFGIELIRTLDGLFFANSFNPSGRNLLIGSNAAQTINGSVIADLIYGLGGNDRLVGGRGSDSIEGGTGNDVILGGTESDTLLGSEGNDTLRGEDGIDQLFGDSGNDRLEGGSGNDLLDGGSGNDVLFGGVGGDRFVFNDGSRSDRIMDFRPEDTILLDRDLWNGSLTASAVVMRFAVNTPSAVVFNFGDDVLIVQGVLDRTSLIDDLGFI